MTSSKDFVVKKEPETVAPKKSDFSIEHILTKAGNGNKSPEVLEYRNLQSEDFMAFSWLNCTRYCPPKLPRTHKKEGPHKRQLGRHPRIPFSSQQLAVLEDKFKQSPYLSSSEVTQLSRTLQLADIRVKIWFQNRRARERREKNEHEIQQLKPSCTVTNESKQYGHVQNEIPIPSPIMYKNIQFQSLIEQTNQNINVPSSLALPVPVTSIQNYENYPNISCFVQSKHL